MQLSFDLPELASQCEQKQQQSWPDVALLYTSSFREGGTRNVRFAMSRDDAMKFCESPRSNGVMHGSPWAFFWTSLENFAKTSNEKLDFRNCFDNGSRDALIAELGLKKILLSEIPALVAHLGVRVVV